MPATSTIHYHTATHARHAAHAAAWRVLARTSGDRRGSGMIAVAARVGDGVTCDGAVSGDAGRGDGRGAGRRAELDRRIEEKVRGEVERMEGVARRVLCDIEY